MKTFYFIASAIAIANALEIKNMTDMCATCLMSSDKNYFSCTQCYDSKVTANACGWVTNNRLECPRDPACPNQVITDDDIKKTHSLVYALNSGKSCVFKIDSNLSDADKQSYWKLNGNGVNSSYMHFTSIPSVAATDVTKLVQIDWDTY